jgi:putative glutamine amidotransferase
VPRERLSGWSGDGVALPARYVDAIRHAGGQEALFLPTAWEPGEADELLDRVDGLLLAGGGDLDPATYGHAPGAAVYGVDAGRDACELELVTRVLARGVPTLAICRGHQVLAVATGGTLDPDIAGREGLLHHGVPGVDDGARAHEVDVTEDSRLADALATSHATVSSHHHQAVTAVADPLRTVSVAPDGVIEAIELGRRAGPWIVGVQWHPEDTAPSDPVQQRLFDEFVRQCRAAARSTAP